MLLARMKLCIIYLRGRHKCYSCKANYDFCRKAGNGIAVYQLSYDF